MSDQCMHSSEHVWYNDGLVLQAVTVECSNVVDWRVVFNINGVFGLYPNIKYYSTNLHRG